MINARGSGVLAQHDRGRTYDFPKSGWKLSQDARLIVKQESLRNNEQ